jgi:hypothetical protein
MVAVYRMVVGADEMGFLDATSHFHETIRSKKAENRKQRTEKVRLP